jgi:two-component system NarL family sensor kinase
MHTPEESFYTAVAVAATVLGVIIGYFIITMIRHQRRNVRLYRTRIQAEILTLENERKRIATDLHDELGPLLSAVRIQINHLECDSEHDKKIVAFASKHIDDILTKTREISYNLLPNTLVRKGLIKAVQEYINKLSGIHSLQITLSGENYIEIAKEREVNIFRIIQEIIHNAIKHSEATRLVIELTKMDANLVLMTADNGKGFDFDGKLRDQNGLGLFNLASRTEILKGNFSYKTEPGKGTQYTFEIPIN